MLDCRPSVLESQSQSVSSASTSWWPVSSMSNNLCPRGAPLNVAYSAPLQPSYPQMPVPSACDYKPNSIWQPDPPLHCSVAQIKLHQAPAVSLSPLALSSLDSSPSPAFQGRQEGGRNVPFRRDQRAGIHYATTQVHIAPLRCRNICCSSQGPRK